MVVDAEILSSTIKAESQRSWKANKLLKRWQSTKGNKELRDRKAKKNQPLKIVGNARLGEHVPFKQFKIANALSLYFLSSLKKVP